MWRAVAAAATAFAVLCAAETPARATLRGLRITSDAEASYNDVIVKRVNDSLSLYCGMDGRPNLDGLMRWSVPRATYLSRVNKSGSAAGWVVGAHLEIAALRLEDTGLYICAGPSLSISKYMVVQPPASAGCARGGFSCGHHCVLPMYVCDGHPDCAGGEDESEQSCGTTSPCEGKLSCGDGRCISEAWCCDGAAVECVRPACCMLYSSETPDVALDQLGQRADYGFIQSTIYTVTACALIFMIAVVLLVSAICKMHMKRAALRSYERARQHYGPPCQFPPCYDVSEPLAPTVNLSSPGGCEELPAEPTTPAPPRPTSLGLGRLADSIFSTRYSRVPTQCCDVEMSTVTADTRCAEACSPQRQPASWAHPPCVGDEGYCGAPLEYLVSERVRPRALRRATAVERLIDRLTFDTSYRVESMEQQYGAAPGALTFQLGRFQLSLPRLARRAGRRPDTPNVEEVNIDELEFVRLNSNDTYTLNGRTIHLLGANFENYPNVGNATSFVGRVVAPPPYSEVVTVAPSKIFGPPPAYLSRENLTDDNANNRMSVASTSSAQEVDCNGNTDVQAPDPESTGAELPPRYESVGAHLNNCDNLDANANASDDANNNE